MNPDVHGRPPTDPSPTAAWPADDPADDLVEAYWAELSAGDSPDPVGWLRSRGGDAAVAAQLHVLKLLHKSRTVHSARPLDDMSPRRETSSAVSLDETAQNLDSPTHSLDEPAQSLKVGDVLAEKLHILGLLGVGGMGEVYVAWHDGLECEVAVKVLPASLASDQAANARFRKSIAAQAKAGGHEHIVGLMDAGEYAGRKYLVMEYVPGVDLLAVLRREGPLPWSTACEWMRQVALGLDYAHRQGLLHRDIKPSNLMRAPDGTIKLLDWGLARSETASQSNVGSSDRTAADMALGTYDYMAPEQACDAATADARSDLYSLGCTLYQLLAGKAPFAGHVSALAKVTAHCSESPPRLREVRPDVPAELEKIVGRLLEKQPERRLASARELADALGRVQPPRKRSGFRIALMAAPLFFLAAIWVIIRDKDGNEVSRVRVPDGGSATVVPSSSTEEGNDESDSPKGERAKQIVWQPGVDDENVLPGYIRRPTPLSGVKRWQVTSMWPNTTSHDLKWSPDGKWLASASDIVRVYELTDGRLRLARVAPGTMLGWTGDGAMLAIGADATVRFLDVANDRVKTVWKDFKYWKAGPAAWHPSGKILAIADGGTIRFFDQEGKPTKTIAGHTGNIQGFAWSDDGRQLASCAQSDKAVRLWNQDGSAGPVLEMEEDTESNGLSDVVWSPDDRLVAALADPKLTVWTREGEQQQAIPLGGVWSVAWSLDGTLAAAQRDTTLQLFKAPSFEHLRTVPGKWIGVNFGQKVRITWHPSGKFLAMCDSPGMLRIYDAAGESFASTIPAVGRSPNDVSWSTDGQRIAVGNSDTRVRTFHPEGRLEHVLKFTAGTVSAGAHISGDGRLIATWGTGGARFGSDSAIRIWDTAMDKAVAIIPGSTDDATAIPGFRANISWSPDNSTLAWLNQGMFRLWDAVERKHLKSISPPEGSGGFSLFFWSTDGVFLATVGGDKKELRIWNARSGEQVDLIDQGALESLGGPVNVVVWSRDGKRLFLGTDTLRSGNLWPCTVCWDLEERKVLWRTPDTDPYALISDGREIACWFQDSQLGRDVLGFLDAETGSMHHAVEVHVNRDRRRHSPSPAWGPDNKVLFSDSRGALHAYQYDVETLTSLWTSVLVGEDRAAVFTPAGQLTNPDPEFNEELIYYVEHDDGRFECLKPTQFADRFPGAFAPYLAAGAANADAGKLTSPPLKPLKGELAFKVPGFDQWAQQVANLPAEEQVRAVVKKLQELNPGFDGNETHEIADGQVTELQFFTNHVTDISPVRALRELKALNCDASATEGALSDLSPLHGMKLKVLHCIHTKVSDLSPLKGIELAELDIESTHVSDLTPLAGMKLTVLRCVHSPVSDLSPLKDMKLAELSCSSTSVFDLSPLKEMKLVLAGSSTLVSDLSPLKDMKLEELEIISTRVSDLSPLKAMQLSVLCCVATDVSDLSPLKDMKLVNLSCGQTPVADLSPLKDMQLRSLQIDGTQVSDLSPLRDMKLVSLGFSRTPVSDVSPLRDMKLIRLECQSTPVSDLTALKEMKLEQLWCNDTKVSDLGPLHGMPLKLLVCDFKPERDSDILRSLKSLETINGKPAAEFWRQVDEMLP